VLKFSLSVPPPVQRVFDMSPGALSAKNSVENSIVAAVWSGGRRQLLGPLVYIRAKESASVALQKWRRSMCTWLGLLRLYIPFAPQCATGSALSLPGMSHIGQISPTTNRTFRLFRRSVRHFVRFCIPLCALHSVSMPSHSVLPSAGAYLVMCAIRVLP